MVGFDDADSNVFHKVLALPGEPPSLITLGGMKAAVKALAMRPEFRAKVVAHEK